MIHRIVVIALRVLLTPVSFARHAQLTAFAADGELRLDLHK